MAQWKNSMVRGILDVTEQYCITERGYNLSKVYDDEQVIQVIGDNKIDSSFVGKDTRINGGMLVLDTDKLVLKLNDKNTIGINTPESTGAEEGQIYFKIIN